MRVLAVIGIIFLFPFFIQAKGTQTAVQKGSNSSPFGYYIYFPENYDTSSDLALLINLGPKEEYGNGTTELSKVLNSGPSKEVNKGKDFPMIIVSPQSQYFWNPTLVDNFVEFLKATYKVDKKRIYISGQGDGGTATFAYYGTYASKVAAAVAIGGHYGATIACDVKDVPLWAFDGDQTSTRYGSIPFVAAVNACLPTPNPLAKMTLYAGVSGEAWTRTWDGTAGNDVYTWMLQYSLLTRKNTLPTVNAGLDDFVVAPANTSILKGTAADADGEITSTKWTKISGPASANIQSPNSMTSNVSSLVVGEYVFQLEVTDDQGGKAYDQVNITVASINAGADCGCDFTIELNQYFVDGSKLSGLKGGDVICIKAGVRSFLEFKNIKGAKGNPITIKNCGGQVFFKNEKDNGIFQFKECEYFRVTGTGDPNFKYGIKVGRGGVDTAIRFGGGCTEFEADHLEVAHAGFAGIMIKSDPMCSMPQYWRENFEMRNLLIHDNYIHDTYGEGFYIGHYAYDGLDTSCGKLFPHLIKNLKVYNNYTFNTGAEGIDVGCADEGMEIYDNIVENYGISPFANFQNNGMIAGGGTAGLVYNNIIKNGPGNGLQIFGIGDNIVFNNVIINAGFDGIYANDASNAATNTSYVFANNTIVNPKNVGIRVSNEYIKNTIVKNNIIVSANSTKINGAGIVQSNNIVANDASEIKFQDANGEDFRLITGSKAIDAGTDMSAYGVTFDFDKNKRPSNGTFDVGAFEFGSSPAGNAPIVNAGSDKTVTLPVSSVSFTGSASDVDGNISSYLWTQVSGPNTAALTDANKLTMIASGLVAGNYVFKLTVKDSDNNTTSDQVALTVNAASNIDPNVNAGVDKTVTLPVASVSISGTASDPDGSIAKIAWTQVSGPNTAKFSGANTLSLIASGLIAGSYTFRLTVTDNGNISASDDMVLKVNAASNVGPNVNAGEDKTVTLPVASVSISGTASDPDGSIAKIAWTQVSGPNTAKFSGANTLSLIASGLIAGSYTFRLTVTDNGNISASDDMVLKVNAASNVGPNVNAGEDKTV
ncbi:MAG: hypothetical protein HC819_23105, partial [Cyclobacteriaceae bacterium]|nr:hypothetical protein [Cyclobacteriaceae bacterium]